MATKHRVRDGLTNADKMLNRASAQIFAISFMDDDDVTSDVIDVALQDAISAIRDLAVAKDRADQQ